MTVIDAGGLAPGGSGENRPRGNGPDEDGPQVESAAGHIHGICLKTGPPRRVGVELEWLVRDVHNPALPVSAERIAAAVAGFDTNQGGADRGEQRGPRGAVNGEEQHGSELPTRSRPGVLPSGAPLTSEPGGQLEVSSLPADSLASLVRATTADLTALRAAVAAAGLELAGIGLDPLRPPHRVLEEPRYAAMEAFFDRAGPWGRQMMCGTASVQVCLDAGDESAGPVGYRWRWRLLHALGPVLIAAFANSPLRAGRPTGWVSSRQQVWSHMDPGRTQPPERDPDPRAAWAAYALDAEVMCVRDDESGDWSAPPGLTLRDWVGGRASRSAPASRSASASPSASAGPSDSAARPAAPAPLRPPTAEDLGYHLSTLFPPVRPRGHFELRMIDAQPGDGWIVPLAVCCALLSDAQASEAALAAVAPVWGASVPGASGERGTGERTADDPWQRAAQYGPADPVIARASQECFAVARAALDRMAVPGDITAAVDAFRDQYVARNRCPADALLEGITA